MEDFRIRPKDRYIQEADWRKLYALTECWKCDLLFYRDDLKFLDFLVDKYFIWLSVDENIEEVMEIQNSLTLIDKLSASLLFNVNKHLACIADLVYNPHKYDSSQFRKEHQILEDKLNDFLKIFRENRKEIFALAKQMLKSEELASSVVFVK